MPFTKNVSGDAVTGRAQVLPVGWDAKQAATEVLAGLVVVTASNVKGAHDADMVLVGDRAFVVYEANDMRPDENPAWPFVYAALSVVNLKTRQIERVFPFARSEQVFANVTLPAGACFVPRILRVNDQTLRCFFASEAPGQRQSQTWYIDFDLDRLAFDNCIQRAKIKTAAGIFDMQPQYLQGAVHDYGLYFGDSFKVFDGRTYAALNNFPSGQNALGVLNDHRNTIEVLGHYNEPPHLKLTESAVNRLPDGTWLAICRQEGGDANYTFTTSRDGRNWTSNQPRDFVSNGDSSKPTFDQFNGLYYLGWQERTRIAGVMRSVFNIEVSADGAHWERKFRFETAQSFQYPTFREYRGAIYLVVTQGDTHLSRKERILFGKLE
ncbi:MAG: hypothetical protein PCFJNLEI_00056 [Verrucomicrobiae bacterium]|nr:hypothetical protein [Verrucomicrobiae bacterium]